MTEKPFEFFDELEDAEPMLQVVEEAAPFRAGVLGAGRDDRAVLDAAFSAEALQALRRYQAGDRLEQELGQTAAISVQAAACSVLGPAAAQFGFAEIYERPHPDDAEDTEAWLSEEQERLHEAAEAACGAAEEPVFAEAGSACRGLFLPDGRDHPLDDEPEPLPVEHPDWARLVAERHRGQIRSVLTDEELSDPEKVRAMVEAYLDAAMTDAEVEQQLGSGLFRGMAPGPLAAVPPVEAAQFGSTQLIGLRQADVDKAVERMAIQQVRTRAAVEEACHIVGSSGVQRAASRLAEAAEKEFRAAPGWRTRPDLDEDALARLLGAIVATAEVGAGRWKNYERLLVVRRVLERAVSDPKTWRLLAEPVADGEH